ILFNAARDDVLRELERNGIWYLPLKGIILKNEYPISALREMSDNDILCDGEKMEQVRSVMISLGYKNTEFGKDNHDVYKKKQLSFPGPISCTRIRSRGSASRRCAWRTVRTGCANRSAAETTA
ncbi:MAG: nucleotidyltransferase family protein, partial [Clostridia bacterium]|nr:nucleotidyltransferase family protein [Clostridia bacterium]